MRTLVVFSALAAVALAAPALFEEGSEDLKKFITNVPDVFNRERKATQEPSFGSNLTPEAPANLPSTSQISDIGVSGRSFGLKKPIIIKKKQGYHVYRDSDEEQADSSEICGKQVKVKVCDEKSEEKLRSSNVEDTNTLMMEEDMKHNIQLAKEAVENLQRDLKIVESKPDKKTTSWHHGNSESDAKLHQDIEVAREALEHIQKNFGNLESISLHAKALQDNVQFTIAKNEEQRLAQWKEAVDTIQKNVEIATNIEDSFKATPGETGLLFADNTAVPKHKPNTMNDHFKRTAEDMVTKVENCRIDHEHEKSSEKENINGVLINNDMMPSASTMSEKKMEDLQDLQKSIHASGMSTDVQVDKALKSDKSLDNIHKDTNVDTGSMFLKELSQNHNLVSESMKTMDENKEIGTESELNDKKLQHTESTESVPSFPKKMKSVESEDMLLGLKRNAEATTPMTQQTKFLKFGDNVEKLETSEQKHPEIKSAEDFDEQNSNLYMNERKTQDEKPLQLEQAKEVDTTMFVKSAQQSPTNTQKELLTDDTKIHENKAQKDNLVHQITEEKMQQRGGLNQEMVKQINNAEHQHNKQSSMQQIRETDDLKHMHQNQMVDPLQTRWAADKNLHLQMESVKSADNFNAQTMNQELQNVGHHHHLGHSTKSHHFDTPNGLGQLHSRFPDNIMPHEKSADADMQSHYMSMREGSALGPDGNRFRWKPTHETSRSAYGAPAGPAPASYSSGDAVGVFPNAKISNCGIPLLLSCNPSVMTGSLAKQQSAPYSAPAYRTEDALNFHTKRNVKKTEENQPSPLHRTPANVNLKTSTVLVAKQ